jgi:hypothetical protein
VDGDEWPCAGGRKRLLAAHSGDPDGLAGYLFRVMGKAVGDLRPGTPARLYRRFVGWTLAEDAACRVCGKGGHDWVPDVPPRLVPCDGLTKVMPPVPEPPLP